MDRKIIRAVFVGKPNAGKSTLFNYLLCRKAGIISPKINTTRFIITCAFTFNDVEFQISDTPGWDQRPVGELGRLITDLARGYVLSEKEVIVYMLDATKSFTKHDQAIYQEICDNSPNVEIMLSKQDLVKPREKLLPQMQAIKDWGYEGVVWPVSCRSGRGIDKFKSHLLNYQFTGKSIGTELSISQQKFAEECTRENAFNLLNQEIPYGLWIETERFRTEDDGVVEIHQIIRLIHERHKGIVVGSKGEMIKKIGMRTRLALQEAWDKSVRLFVNVKVGDHESLLKSCSSNVL